MHTDSILLIQDNPDDVVLTCLALEKNNIKNEVIVKRDGIEALNDLLEDQPDSNRKNRFPKLILIDLNSPKIDGYEITNQLKSNIQTRLIPIVILTTSSETRDILNAYKSGANSYIQKTVNFDEFVQVIKHITNYWLQLNVFSLTYGSRS